MVGRPQLWLLINLKLHLDSTPGSYLRADKVTLQLDDVIGRTAILPVENYNICGFYLQPELILKPFTL